MKKDNLNKERYRRIFMAGGVSTVSKFIQLFAALITLPMVLRHLGAERYGLWMTVVGFISMMVSADLGVGNGLLNAISRAFGEDDSLKIRHLIGNAFVLLFGISIVFGLLGLTFLLLVDLGPFLKIGSMAARHEFQMALWVFLIFFMINLPLSVVEKVQLGHQEGYIESLWSAVGNLLSFFGIIAAVKLGRGLPVLLMALYGVPTLVRAINGMVLFGIRKPFLRPTRADLDSKTIVGLLRLGLLFFVLQLAASIVFTTDNLILSSQLGPASVASYAPAVRIFSLAPLLVGFFVTPLWPAYGEAYARRDYQWISKTFYFSILGILLVVVPFSLIMFFKGEMLLRAWLKFPIQLPHGLLLGMGLWTIMMTLGTASAMLLNGLHVVKFQVVAASCMSILSVILRVVGVRTMGVPGIVWGLTVAYFTCSFVPGFYYCWKMLNGMLVQQNLEAGDPNLGDKLGLGD